MSRINTNVSSLIAQRILGHNGRTLDGTLERLSTGLRINRGKDDPAGLIASEALRAEARGVRQAIDNAERADQVFNIAEGGLQEISDLLVELNGLVTRSANDAGVSLAEREANQLQVNSILQTIDRIADTVNFQGMKLLNGALEYDIENVHEFVPYMRVFGAKLAHGETMDVSAVITQSAQTGALVMHFGPSGSLDLGGASAEDPDARFVLEIGGSLGARELAFASGVSVNAIVDQINTFSEVTGVYAAEQGGLVWLESNEFGSHHFVSVKVVDDGGAAGDGVLTTNDDDAYSVGGSGSVATPFTQAGNRIIDRGQDVGATVNGILAIGRGEVISVDSDHLSFIAVIHPFVAQEIGAIDMFTITGGGADFHLAGKVDIGGKISVGVPKVSTRTIGLTPLGPGDSGLGALTDLQSGGAFNVVDGDNVLAQSAVKFAIEELSDIRGRIGALQRNTVGSTIRSLGVSLENTVAAESIIRDADFAGETSRLTRSQILVSSSTQVLSLSNAQPQNVLALLG